MNLFLNDVHTLGSEILVNKLNNAGYRTKIFIRNYEDLINEVQPEIIYISWNYAVEIFKLLLKLPEIKYKYPKMKVIIGGYSATYDWEYLQELNYIDAIIGGYGDDVIVPCTEDVLNNNITKLKYLKNPPVDLSKYDYEKNIFISKKNSIILETARSCPRILNSPCSYCNQYKEKYVKLDFNEIMRVLRKKYGQYKKIIISDPEVMPQPINTIYEEFKMPISCFTEAAFCKDIKTIGCSYMIGIDHPGSKNPYNPNKNITETMLEEVEKLAKNNNIMGTVIYENNKHEVNHKILDRLYKVMNITFFKLTQFPGTFGKSSPINIYKSTVEEFEKLFYIFDDYGTLQQHISEKHLEAYYFFERKESI